MVARAVKDFSVILTLARRSATRPTAPFYEVQRDSPAERATVIGAA